MDAMARYPYYAKFGAHREVIGTLVLRQAADGMQVRRLIERPRNRMNNAAGAP
jgi:hypothetical protein